VGGLRGVVVCAITVCTITAVWAVGGGAGLGADVHFSRESWDQRAGLPEGIVRGLVRAADGSLAVGSDRGLVRFDGRRGWPLPVAQPVDDLPTIERLLAAGDTLHALLRDGGLVTIHAGRQHYVAAAAARAAAEPACSATSLCRDAAGDVWVALGDGSVGRFARIDANGSANGDASGAAEPDVTWFEPAAGWKADGRAELAFEQHHSAGTLWLAGGGGLFAWRPAEAAFAKVAPLPPGPVRLTDRRAGGLWIAAGSELARVEAGAYHRVATCPAGGATSLCEDETGRLWIGTSRAGLFHLDAGSPDPTFRPAPTAGRGVYALLSDGLGGVWAGTAAGIDHVHPSVMWLAAPPPPRLPVGLGIARGDFWFVTRSGDVGVWRNAVAEVGDESRRPRLEILEYDRGWPSPATCLAVAADGRVLVGTEQEGVVVLEPAAKGGNPLRRDVLALPGECAGCRIDGLLAGPADDVWIATTVGVFARLGGTWRQLESPAGRVQRLAADPEGGAWAATTAGHVVQFAQDGTARRVTTAPPAAGRELSALCPIGDGTAWVAVVDVGLFRVGGGEVAAVGAAEGLESLRIIAAAADGRGRLWCVCGRRLMVIGLDALAAAADGGEACRPRMIDGTDAGPFPDTLGGFLPGTPAADERGRLWLAGHDRLVICDPAAFDRGPIMPPLARIEQMSVDGRVVSGGPGTGGFGLPVDTRPILAPEPRLVEFIVSPGPVGAGAGSRLEHRLLGTDDTWTPTPSDGRLRYSRPRPGSHALNLRVIDDQGRRTAVVEAVRFEVPPRWWERSWVRGGFVVAVATTAALGGLAIASLRGRRRLERLEQEAAVERERARIARDMHDEVGTSLTQVALLAELALGDTDPAAAAGRLEEVVRISRRTVTSIDDLVWAVNPVNDTLGGLLEHLAQSLLDTLGPLGVACHVTLPEALAPAAAPADFRRNVLLVVKEACANVARYAAASEVRFTAGVHAGRLRLALADDGVGSTFTGRAAAGGGQGLANMRRRAEGLGGSCILSERPGGGTVVTLDVPLPGVGSAAG
jgi:signal transduction histidine kinase/ligand-binding sensor domain-containing protein